MSDEVKQTVEKLIAQKHLEMVALQDSLAKLNADGQADAQGTLLTVPVSPQDSIETQLH